MPLMYDYLVAAVLLYLVMIFFQAVSGAMHHGLVLLGPRDKLAKDDSVLMGRAKRASANMLENMVLFIPLVVVAVETGHQTATAEFGAGLFLGARIIYAPAYWFAIPLLRPAAWLTGMVGTLMVASQIIPFTGAA
ncbi:MAG: MAPEG family protein [Pseudomonadota bacterium]